MRKFCIYLSLIWVLALAPAAAIAQCPMCKSNVESAQKSDKKSVGKGLNTGILFLMATPYVLVTTGLIFWMRHRRRQRIQLAKSPFHE